MGIFAVLSFLTGSSPVRFNRNLEVPFSELFYYKAQANGRESADNSGFA